MADVDISFVSSSYCANSGAEGIQKAIEIIPDLIICAIKMKSIGGFQVIKTLKKNSTTHLVPFVFLTRCTDLADVRLAMQMEFSTSISVVKKPVL